MQSLHLPPPPWIVGHRGAAGEAPENTLEGFLLAAEQGADMVEADLQLTADGELVACHDWDLRRTADVATVVEVSPLSALAGLPNLSEILEVLPADLPLNLELKRRQARAARIAEALAMRLGGRRQVLVSSFDSEVLEAVMKRLPGLPLAPIARQDGRALLEAGRRLNAFSLHCHRSLPDPDLVDAAGSDRRPLLAYTVNGVGEARRLLELGVSGLFTDLPGRLRRELEGEP